MIINAISITWLIYIYIIQPWLNGISDLGAYCLAHAALILFILILLITGVLGELLISKIKKIESRIYSGYIRYHMEGKTTIRKYKLLIVSCIIALAVIGLALIALVGGGMKSPLALSEGVIQTALAIDGVLLGLLFPVLLAGFELYKRYYGRVISDKFILEPNIVILTTTLFTVLVVLFIELYSVSSSKDEVMLSWIGMLCGFLFFAILIGFIPMCVKYLLGVSNNPVARDIIDDINRIVILNPPSNQRERSVSKDWDKILNQPSSKLLEIISVNLEHGYSYIAIDIVQKFFRKTYGLLNDMDSREHSSTLDRLLTYSLNFYDSVFSLAYKQDKREVIELVNDCVYQLGIYGAHKARNQNKVRFGSVNFQSILSFFLSKVSLYIKDEVDNKVAIRSLYIYNHIIEAIMLHALPSEDKLNIITIKTKELNEDVKPEQVDYEPDFIREIIDSGHVFKLGTIIKEAIEHRHYGFVDAALHILSGRSSFLCKCDSLGDIQKDRLLSSLTRAEHKYTNDAILAGLQSKRNIINYGSLRSSLAYQKHGDKYFLSYVRNYGYILITLAQTKQLDEYTLTEFGGFGRGCIEESYKPLYATCIRVVSKVFEKLHDVLSHSLSTDGILQGEAGLYSIEFIKLKELYIRSYEELKSIVDREIKEDESVVVTENRKKLKDVLSKYMAYDQISSELTNMTIDIEINEDESHKK